MKTLIIGANGQLGRAFQKLWPEATALNHSDLDLTWDDQAITDVLVSHQPGIILNCAAYTKVDQAEDELELAKRINATSLRALAQASNDLNATLIHFSTDYVFDGTKNSPYQETDPPNPKSIYGQTKLEGEKYARTSKKHSIIRLSCVFGDGANLLKALLTAADKFPEIKAINDQLTRPTYTEDVAQVVRHLLEKAPEQLPNILHLQNSGDPATIADLARELFQQAGKSTPIKEVTFDEYFSGKKVAFRPKYTVFDLSLAESLGLRMPTYQDAIARFLKDTPI